MSAENWTAVIAGATFMVFWTATVLGLAAWISKQLNNLRDSLIINFDAKHAANAQRYDALNALVIRHDTILNPEFNGHFGGHHGQR